ncbi:helix-turn-helix domain-containing protein [Nonomuraea sp. NEAU-A123]|uniref:helix-turn-helix domain-containing protein n=1 Tax=Nonomuraea sp. NEAU-A123 TaxID=2839649 RepID=UPI001BE48AA7|nr:helix-turn-helix domain-containing protein [Nonomuraea sp. NEAU-A123]MBT2227753.1 helix-turn-helix domain-containing protein [Nonomuraea sp. NEAU-A123]
MTISTVSALAEVIDFSLGTLLRTWRKRALLTQEQLAERAGLNVRTVRRLEHDGLQQPRTRSILLLAEALGLNGEERAMLVAVARGPSVSTERDDPAGTGPPPIPRQLPAGVAAFVGRRRELMALADYYENATTMTVVAIDGMAGVGKTALAVHAAHRLTSRFPDGQLFVNLHGHTEGKSPVDPGDALARVLRTLGVLDECVPEHLDDRAALYRSVMADREVLIVLDNAADEDQVRPLLPADPGCGLIVTSRRRLIALDDTRTLSLDVLPLKEAVDLFTRTAGEERVTDAPATALVEIVERCGLLPLAIRIAAVQLQARATWSLGHLLNRLTDDRLAELTAGPHSVAVALDLSYQRLPEDQRRVYRLLGARVGTEFGVTEAAAALDTTVVRARRLLDQLLDAHLLQESAPCRYRFHELVRDHVSALPHPTDAVDDLQGVEGGVRFRVVKGLGERAGRSWV